MPRLSGRRQSSAALTLRRGKKFKLDCPAKKAILDFVRDAAEASSKDFVPAEERIASQALCDEARTTGCHQDEGRLETNSRVRLEGHSRSHDTDRPRETQRALRMDGGARSTPKNIASLGWISVWGPGLSVMLADTDAGNVVIGAQVGAQWGYRLLPLLLLLIPMLYMVQELTVRLGLHTGRGHVELIRERFGVGWAWLSTAGLAAATIGSLVTEFTGVAGIGEIYGLSRALTLPIAAGALLAIVATSSYRRVERTAVVIGLFELAFFAVAWAAHPNLGTLAMDVRDLPLGNQEFMYLAAAVIGATFNPWMIFYQQSAIADKKLSPEHINAAQWDTAFGATLTQCLTGAVLVAAAATLASHGASAGIGSVGEISNALTPLLGESVGQLVFSAGVLGASLVAAIVCSLALALGGGRGRGLPAFAGKSSL
jgi:Mn2+/Fe2+ NRAMP family transporter